MVLEILERAEQVRNRLVRELEDQRENNRMRQGDRKLSTLRGKGYEDTRN